MKILLVEDEPPLASFVKKGFEHEGYDVTVAYDGRTGWSFYEQQPYDLVILDVNLPYVNGVELCPVSGGLASAYRCCYSRPSTASTIRKLASPPGPTITWLSPLNSENY